MRTTIALFITGLALATLVACGSPPPISAVTSVAIDGGDRTIVLGDTPTLTATVTTNGTAATAVSWTSSNEAAATIDTSGTITTGTTGTTDLTATSEFDPTKNDTITLAINPQGALRWTRQFGTSSNDYAARIATDANGNVYTTGYTLGALEGTNAGSYDAFIRAYDPDGNVRWTRQFGTSSFDFTSGIATDANGNVYATGRTEGALEGSNAGNFDAFIRAYDPNGDLRWTRQFGTASDDFANGITTDANGNVYGTGYTSGALEGTNAGSSDAFIRAYDPDGNLRWTRQFGTASNDVSNGITTDANGNVYTTGYTNGALEGANAGSSDAFIRTYDPDGNLRWTRQFGTASNDTPNGIATDTNSNVYTTGYTNGALEGANAGNFDAFIRAYDPDGNLRWTRQFGTASDDISNGITTDANGNVHTAGYTGGALEGSSAGDYDAFIRAYGPDGSLRWTRQFGTASPDRAFGIATDASGNVYSTGYTLGALEGPNAGSNDAFIRSYGR